MASNLRNESQVRRIRQAESVQTPVQSPWRSAALADSRAFRGNVGIPGRFNLGETPVRAVPIDTRQGAAARRFDADGIGFRQAVLADEACGFLVASESRQRH